MCPSIDDRLSPGPHGEPPASARGPAAKAGLLPGSLLHVGEPSSREVSFHCMRYTPTDLEEFTIADLGALAEVHRGPGVCWVDVDGLHDLDSIRAVCGVFEWYRHILSFSVRCFACCCFFGSGCQPYLGWAPGA